MLPPTGQPAPTGLPPSPGMYPPPWAYSPLGMHPPTGPPRPPPMRPRPHCTHRTVEMDFSTPCSLCGEVPHGGFVYACRQDADDEVAINTRKTRYAYKDIRNPAEELTSIGVNPSIVKSATEGCYTSEELGLVVAQRLKVIEACKQAEEKEALKHGRLVRSPSSLNLHPVNGVHHSGDKFESSGDLNGRTMPDQAITDDDDLYGPQPQTNKGKSPIRSDGGERPPPSTAPHHQPPDGWYVPTGAQHTQQHSMRPPPHIPPCDFRACGECRGFMEERVYGSIDAVARDDFHPSSFREASRRPTPRSASTMHGGFHASAGMRERSADETGETSSAADSFASSEGSSDYSHELEEGHQVDSSESSEGTKLPRAGASVASLAIGFRSASLINLKPVAPRLRINTESSPALHSRYRDEFPIGPSQRHVYPTEPIYEMDSRTPRTPITPKGSDNPQPPMPPIPPYDSEEDVVWNRAKPIAHKNYYDNGTYFQGTYHRPFKLSDLPRRAATFMGIRGPISPRAMLDRAKITRKATDRKDLPNGTILHSDTSPSQTTSSQAPGEVTPSNNPKSARPTGRPAGAFTPESFITRTESSLKTQKNIARKRSMTSLASSLKRMVSGSSGKTKGFEVIRRNSEPAAADALPPEDYEDPRPGTAL